MKRISKMEAAVFLIRRLGPTYDENQKIWNEIIKKLSVKQILFLEAYLGRPKDEMV